MATTESPSGRDVVAVIAVSALAGFAMGALRPSFQVAIEPAQVLAGIVHYQDGNSFGLYQRSVWTVWHQVLAPLLAAGVPERALSVLVSGLLGALAFVGIGLVALAVGAAPWLACGVPFLLAFADPSSWGFGYGIYLLDHGHTYGAAGLDWLLIVIGLFGVGRWRAAAFALGFAPAVHVSLGAWLMLVVGACAAASWRDLLPRWREILGGGTLGALLAAASLGLHFAQVPHARIEPAEATLYLETFVRLWDAHRLPPVLVNWRGATVLCAAGIALLESVRGRPPVAARFALRILALAAVTSLGLGVFQNLVPPDALPGALLIAMPTRLLNLPMLTFLPLVAGVLWRRRADPLAQVTLLVLAVGALAAGRESSLLLSVGSDSSLLLAAGRDSSLVTVGLPLLGVAALMAILRLSPASALATARRAVDSADSVDVVVALACAVAVAFGLFGGVRDLRPHLKYLRDRTNDSVFAAASRRPGVLAVGSDIEVAQLRTLRPLLLDPGALDMLPYALAGGPAMARILERVYGVDFFRPPEKALHKASLPGQEVRDIWEARTPSEWGALGQEFQFSDVLVVGAWRLKLPEVARNRRAVLYRVSAESQ